MALAFKQFRVITKKWKNIDKKGLQVYDQEKAYVWPKELANYMMTMYDNSIRNQKLLNFDYFNSMYNSILTILDYPIFTNEYNIMHVIDIIPD